jgi:AcrR family transcriptional regulator
MTQRASMPTRTPKPRSKDAYHHGDLRNTLLAQALAAGSLESISLRQLAASVGVSAAAVYRHFQSKDDLLLALAGGGFDALRVRFANCFDITQAPGTASEAVQRMHRLASAYLEFAAAEPERWRLMFGPLAGAYRAQPAAADTVNTLDYLRAVLWGLYRCNVLPREPGEQELLFAWATIHGLASLRDGLLPLAQAQPALLAQRTVTRILAGLQPSNVA